MPVPTVGIVDYRAGNIRSIASAFEHAGAHVEMVAEAASFDGLTHLVLPGVGAFRHCAENLRASGLLPRIEAWALTERRPFLGICVGMQMMADHSEEMGRTQGLGWIGGAVTRLEKTGPGIRIPHVGWNEVAFDQPVFGYAAGERADFYFDHSFAFRTADEARVASCHHGSAFAAVVRRDNIVASQFHPEKSQRKGMRFLEGFLATEAA